MSSAAKRIQTELAKVSLEPPTNCSAGPKGDNLYEWVSSIMGPTGASSPSSTALVRLPFTAFARVSWSTLKYDQQFGGKEKHHAVAEMRRSLGACGVRVCGGRRSRGSVSVRDGDDVVHAPR